MSDEDIIGLYFIREEKAISETARQYGRYLYTVAFNILRRREDAEEAVNDAYQGAWQAIPPAKPDSLKLFLARICRNTAIDRLEYLKAQKRGAETELLLSELSECIPGGDAEQEWSSLETGRSINGFLATLDTESRVMFLNRYWYGCSVRETAKKLGVTESRVKNTLFRVRSLLRAHLEKEGVTL